jgi:hypothetical protein
MNRKNPDDNGGVQKKLKIKFKVPQIKEIPVPKGNKHPAPKYAPILPTHEFTWGVISPKGAGKTTFIINLLELYKDYFNEIIIFSPTLLNDDKWDYAKKLKVRVENIPLIKFLKSLEEDDEENKMFPHLQEKAKSKEKFKQEIPETNFISEYSEEGLKRIVQEQDDMIKFLKEHDKPKYLANRILLMFDDLVGSDLFGTSQKNFFTGFNTRHRHLGMSMFMISQAVKAIPDKIRTQWSCLTLYRIGSEKEVEKIYEEFPMGLKRDEWDAVYRYCTEGRHDFMFIDFQKPRGQQIMKNFDTFILEGDQQGSEDSIPLRRNAEVEVSPKNKNVPHYYLLY